jgi:hypothetical protein
VRRWLLLSLLLLAGSPCLAGDHEPEATLQAERFVQNHASEPIIYFRHWVDYDLRFLPRDRGLSGKLVEGFDYRIQDRSVLREMSSVTVSDDPRMRIKGVEVEIRRMGETEKHGRGDLRWTRITKRKDGTVTLDGTISIAIIPGLRVGDRVSITCTYELRGIYGLGSIMLGDPHYPTMESSLELKLPLDHEVGWGELGPEFAQDALTHEVEEHGNQQIHRWLLQAKADGSLPRCREEYPAVRVTPYVRRAGSYPNTSMAVGASWAAVGQAFLARIDGLFEPSDEIRSEVERILAGTTDRADSISSLYTALQKRYRYLGLYEGMGNIIPVRASQVFRDGFGDCKGLGGLLISMLRAAGIRSHPVLVRTRSIGPLDTSAPNLGQFDHFIVWVDDGLEGMFLDATVDHCPAGQVPDEDTLSPVLLLDPAHIGLVDIPPESWSAGMESVAVSGRLDELNMLEVTIEQKNDGGGALQFRYWLAGLSHENREKLVRKLILPDRTWLHVDDIEVAGQDADTEPLVFRASAQSPAPLPGSGKDLLLPFALCGDHFHFDPVLLCDKSVDLRRWQGLGETWSIELDPELSLGEPDSTGAEVKGMRWSRRIWQEGRTLHLERSVEFTPELVSAREAEAIRDALEAMRKSERGYFLLRHFQESTGQ